MSEEEQIKNTESKKSRDLGDELDRIKQEMEQMRKEFSEKRTAEADIAPEAPLPPKAPKAPKFKFNFDEDFVFDDKEFAAHIDFDGFSDTISDYLQNVASGIRMNFAQTMAEANKAMGQERFKAARAAAKEAQREAKRARKELRNDLERIKKHARGDHRARRIVTKFSPLSDDLLQKFYENGPSIANGLADIARVQILKRLEKGPAYPADLTEATIYIPEAVEGETEEQKKAREKKTKKDGLTGGSLKHHIKILEESGFIYQEGVRGRHLITQFGVEALKLLETLFRRGETLRVHHVDIEFDEDDFEDEIDAMREELEEDIEAQKEQLENISDQVVDIIDETADLEDQAQDVLEEADDLEADKLHK